MNILRVVKALKELSGLLEGSHCRERVDKIIRELEYSDIDELRLQQIKHELSTKILFHPKCLGDVYVQGFDQNEWWDYLYSIADICQRSL